MTRQERLEILMNVAWQLRPNKGTEKERFQFAQVVLQAADRFLPVEDEKEGAEHVRAN